MEYKSRILIVDDDPGVLETFGSILEDQGYELDFAGNGSEALKKAAELVPDLILTDAMMPEIDGFEVCSRLRKDPLLAEVPIIMVTALNDQASVLKGIEAGADDFISKPVDIDEIRARVKTITRLNRYRLLLSERIKFEKLVNLSPDGIIIIDAEKNIRLANPAIEDMLGVNEGDSMVGKNLTDFILPEHIEKISLFFDNIIIIGTSSFKIETYLVPVDNEPFPVEINTGFLTYDDEPSSQLIVRDITETKKNQDELIDARRKAEAANNAKTEFLANISHEIRTPMNGIMGFAEILLEEDLTDEQKDSLEIIYKSGESLLSLINNILDLSKIELGKMEVVEVDFDLIELLNENMSILTPKAWEKEIDLTMDVKDTVIPKVIGDVDKVRQIIINLAGNAVKFTEAGRVDISVDMEHTDEERPILTISVTDTGPGISPEELENIFDPFIQADTSHTRRFGGTGLGLSISKRFVELLGGEIQVSSELNKGSTFTFSIPIKKTVKRDEVASTKIDRAKYLKNLTNEYNRLTGAVNNNDFDEINRVSHELKEQVEAFEHNSISVLLGQIEGAAREQNQTILSFFLKSLEEEIENIDK